MIYVFKTSVKTKSQARRLRPHLEQLLPKAKWNFDLQNRDKILRIDSDENVVFKIKSLLTVHQFHCEELE